jgi:hypothetical protein
MFLTLLFVTFGLAFVTAGIIARAFRDPVDRILARIISDDISSAWHKYILFAIYVTGVSNGVRIWNLEKYITPRAVPQMRAESMVEATQRIVELTTERWVLEVYARSSARCRESPGCCSCSSSSPSSPTSSSASASDAAAPASSLQALRRPFRNSTPKATSPAPVTSVGRTKNDIQSCPPPGSAT